jgi:hypothetical protein
MAITRNAAAFLTGLNSLSNRLRGADLDIFGINAQTSIVSLLSDRLRIWIHDHEDEISAEERESLSKCVTTCDELVKALREATDKTNQEKSEKLRFRDRVRLLFNQPQLDRFANTLAQQVSALNTYLQIFTL